MASRRSRRRRLSDAEREQRREAHRRQLTEAVEALLSSEGWRRWVRARGRNGLARYSLNNQLMIALRCPQATYVCGFRAWIELGYCVRKGERAIRILAPMTVRLAADDPAARNVAGDGEDDERVFFRAVPVFDCSQVDPLPDRESSPIEAPREPITGDSHRRLLGPLRALAGELGYRVDEREDTGAADGWCDHDDKLIVVAGHLAGNAKVRVLVHELAHALGIGYADYGRARAEVLVDTVTYIVCAGAGLDVSGESVPYVAGWGQEDAGAAVTRFAGVVDEVARRIEAAIDAETDQRIDGAGAVG
jgi:hypothetical protein